MPVLATHVAGQSATRPSRTWGALCCRAEWSTGPPLGGGMVLGKSIVRNSGADLQHAMGASRGPTHLLVGAHPTVQQPLHRALRGCRRDRLVAALCRRIIDDQVRLPGDVGLEPSQQRRCLRRGRQCRLRHALKRGQCLPNEIQGTLHLTVPEAPADVLDRIGQLRLVRALARRVSGPSRVTNWAEYDAALRARGSLTVWFTPEAVAAWAAAPRTTRGGQASYSDLAIATALTLRAVFRLALRQTEGLIGSILQLLGLDLAVPDHSTLSRRAETLEVPPPQRRGSEPVHLLVDSTGLRLFGPGGWLQEKHGSKRRRAWRVLHLATDADTGQIVASVLTGRDADDGSQVGPLLDHVDGPVASFTGDGAYDRDDVYAEVAAHHPDAAVVVPPRANAVPSEAAETAPTQRDRHLRCIAERGRMGWQRASGYNWRALVEADISRWKRVIGDGLAHKRMGGKRPRWPSPPIC